MKKGVGALTVRDWQEADDILDNWVTPRRRDWDKKRVYGPFDVDEQMRLLRELRQKLEKKPELLAAARTELSEMVDANPDKSRFQIRLDIIRNQIKKVRMAAKFKKAYLNLYVIFKARLIVDGIFGDDLLTNTIQKSNNEQGYTSEKPEPLVEDTASVEALLKIKEKYQGLFDEHRFEWEFHRDFYGGDKVSFLAEALKFVRRHKKPSPARNSPPKKPSPKKPSTGAAANNTARSQSLSNSPPKTKRKRCPKGTRFNKKTQKCEPKK
jgi:hypothetical protein